jgi:hypothetical protein
MKDPDFHQPSKILGNPPPHNKEKNCDFHKTPSYHTERCIALRLLIEKFIKNEKLIRFIWEQRNQQENGRPQDQPQDHILKTTKPRSIRPGTGSPQITTLEDLLDITIGDEMIPSRTMKGEEKTADEKGA